MSRIKFELDIEPMSVNQVYYGNRSHGWTADAKEWSYRLIYQLSKHENQIKIINSLFDPKKHGLSVSFTVSYPDFIKKAGGISSRTQDVDNVLKPMIDVLFNKKFNGTNIPYTCQNFNIDDKHIVELTSRKVAGPQKIVVEVAVVPL